MRLHKPNARSHPRQARLRLTVKNYPVPFSVYDHREMSLTLFASSRSASLMQELRDGVLRKEGLT